MELARQEGADRERLPPREPVELRDYGLDVEREMERGEAAGWVPAAAVNPRARSRPRLATGTDMAKRLGHESGRSELVDRGDELLLRHELDEHAVGERVDGAQHASEITSAKKIDRLVMVERRVRREEPVVGRARPESP